MATAGVLILIWLYWPWLSGERDFFASDLTYIYEPVCSYLRSSIQEGRIALWNPYSYCGMPQIAVPSPGLLYPLTHLMTLLPFSQGTAAYLVLHQTLAGIGGFLYLNRLGFGRRASMFGGYCLAFSGYMFAMQKFPDYVATIAWLPLGLYAAISVLRSSGNLKAFFLALLSISTGLMIYAGRPEIFVPGLVLLLMQSLAEAKQNARLVPAFRSAVPNFFAIAIGIMFAAPMIMPVAEWLSLSPRSMGISKNELFIWSATWYDWISTILWEPFGDLMQSFGPENDNFLALINKDSGRSPLLSPVYLGPGFATATLIGALNKSFKPRWLILSLFALFCLLAAGNQTPFAPSLADLFPQVQLFRYPVKLLIFPTILAIILATHGFNCIASSTAGEKTIKLIAAFWFIILLAGTSLLLTPSIIALLQAFSSLHGISLPAADLLRARSCLAISFFASSLFGLAFCAVAYARQKSKLTETKASFALALIAILPMIVYGLESQAHSAAGGFYTKPQVLRSMLDKLDANNDNRSSTDGRVLYLNLEPLSIPNLYFTDKSGSTAELYHTYVRDVMYPNCHFSTNRTYSNGYVLAETAQIINLYNTAIQCSSQCESQVRCFAMSDYPLSHFCSLTSTEYVVTKKWAQYAQQAALLEPQLFQLLADDDRLNIRIYRNKIPTKRFFLAGDINIVKSWATWEKVIGSLSVPIVLDDDSTSILEGTVNSAIMNPEAERTQSNLTVLEDKPETVKISVDAPQASLLVAKDQYYPGWIAEVDGEPTTIIRANLFNRAIEIPPGKHQVTFHYHPESLWNGIKLACLGLFALLALCWLARLRTGDTTSAGT